MKPSQLQAVLWDMDGTLIDTEALHFEAWQQTFDKYGVKATRETQSASFGMNSTGIVEYHFGYRPSQDVLDTVIGEKEVLFRRNAVGRATAFPNVERWLDYFKAHAIPQVIASSAPMESIEVLVDWLGLAHYFCGYYAGAELPAKPDPLLFLTAARDLGADPAQCLVIEDSTNGVKAALNAGMHCLAITGTHGKAVQNLTDVTFSGYDADVEALLAQL